MRTPDQRCSRRTKWREQCRNLAVFTDPETAERYCRNHLRKAPSGVRKRVQKVALRLAQGEREAQ